MLFLDSFSSVLPNPSDTPAIEITKCRQGGKFCLLTPSTVAIYSIERLEPFLVTRFDATPDFQAHGLFLQSSWLSATDIAVLTSVGKILIFRNGAPDAVIAPGEFKKFVVIASHSGLLLAGDIDGDLLGFSPDFKVVKRHKVSDAPIKSIVVSPTGSLVVTGDSEVFAASVNRFEFKKLPVVGTGGAMSQKDNVIAVSDPSGTLYITNLKDLSEKVEGLPPISALSFCPQSSSVALLCPGAIGLWNMKYRRMTFFAKPECEVPCSMIYDSQMMIVATHSGVYTYPLFVASRSKVPTLFSRSSVIEYRGTTGGIAAVVHDASPVGQIQFAVADGFEKFIAVATHKKVGLINRKTMTIVPLNGTFNVKGLEWHREQLVVVVSDAKVFSLHFFVSILNGLRRIKVLPLPGPPHSIASDNSEALVCSFANSLMVINRELQVQMIRCVGMSVIRPCPKLGQIFGISSKRELVRVSMETGETEVLRASTDDVFVSAIHSLVFAVERAQIYVSRLNSISFRVFKRKAAAPIGIDSKLGGIIQVRDAQFFLGSYAAIGAFLHLQDNVRLSMSILEKKPADDLLQTVVYAVEEHLGKEALEMLQAMDVAVDDILPQILERVDPQFVREIGRPIDVFLRITEARMDDLQFVSDQEIPVCSVKLLQMIFDDEGVAVAVAAAVFCLSKLYGEEGEKLEQIFELLQLMEQNSDKVGQTTYQKLAKLRDDAVQGVLVSLLTNYQLVAFVSMAAKTKTPLKSFLTKNVQIDKRVAAGQLKAELARVEVPEVLRRELGEARWRNWTRVLKS
jgi:hypothetical protein